MPPRLLRLSLCLVLATTAVATAAGCAPTERYYTNKNTEPAQPAPRNGPACGMATPVTKLEARSSNQRSVEGFGSFPCTPSPRGPR